MMSVISGKVCQIPSPCHDSSSMQIRCGSPYTCKQYNVTLSVITKSGWQAVLTSHYSFHVLPRFDVMLFIRNLTGNNALMLTRICITR